MSRARELATDVEVTKGGKKFNCEVVDSANEFIDPSHISAEGKLNKVKTWCVTSIPVEASSDFNLQLKYKGSLMFADWEVSKTPLSYFDNRTLSYLLFPAGYWKGPIESLEIIVDAGRYQPFGKVISPKGSTVQGNSFQWHLKNVNLKDLSQIEIEFSKDAAEFDERSKWNARAKILKAKAFSELVSGKTKYSVNNLIDGDPNTAWCEGVKGYGENQVLEFHIDKQLLNKQYCNLQGILIANGYLKSQEVYKANARIKKVKLDSCDGHDLVQEIKTTGNYYNGMHWMHRGTDDVLSRAMEAIKSTGCFKITILEVDKKDAKFEDTCISEVAVLFDC